MCKDNDDDNKLAYICDDQRHIICVPYTIANLHAMARHLGINRCWYHSSSRYPHYDMPKRRIDELKQMCTLVSPGELLNVIKDYKGDDLTKHRERLLRKKGL